MSFAAILDALNPDQRRAVAAVLQAPLLSDTERQRVRLSCFCTVGDVTVLRGEAWVKVPRRQDQEPTSK